MLQFVVPRSTLPSALPQTLKDHLEKKKVREDRKIRIKIPLALGELNSTEKSYLRLECFSSFVKANFDAPQSTFYL